MRKKLLSILALMLFVSTGAWATEVTIPTNQGQTSYTSDDITISVSMVGDGDGAQVASWCPMNITCGDGNVLQSVVVTIGFYPENASDVTASAGSCEVSGDGNKHSTYVTVTGINASSVSIGCNGDVQIEQVVVNYSPSAPAVVASGDCGTSGHESDVTWSLTDDGTLTISGTGAMADYTAASGQPWYSSASDITSIVVEAGVTHIGNNSLRGFTNMTTVTLPEGLLTIGDRAFQADMHTGFTEVNIPASVTSIGAGAFSGCKYLVTVTFSAGTNLTGIGDNAFNGCLALSSINIPEGVTSIGLQTFYNCSGLTSIEIPASVTSIGNKAFFNCSNLTSITLNSNPYLGGTSVYTGGATVTMNLTANGPVDEKYWMTFYNNRYNFVADENTQVFKAELSGTSITLHEVTDKIVNSNTAVVLKSTGNPVMTKTTTSSDNSDTNSLTGVSDAAGLTAPDPSIIYVLNYTAANGVGFYKLAGGKTLEANKAYLVYDGGAGAREFFLFEDDATGINEELRMKNEESSIYNLAGQRIQKMQRGINIVNGKKVLK